MSPTLQPTQNHLRFNSRSYFVWLVSRITYITRKILIYYPAAFLFWTLKQPCFCVCVCVRCLQTVLQLSRVWLLVSSPRKPQHSFEFSTISPGCRSPALVAERMEVMRAACLDFRSNTTRCHMTEVSRRAKCFYKVSENVTKRYARFLSKGPHASVFPGHCAWMVWFPPHHPPHPKHITGLPWIFRGSASSAVPTSENIADTQWNELLAAFCYVASHSDSLQTLSFWAANYFHNFLPKLGPPGLSGDACAVSAEIAATSGCSLGPVGSARLRR